MSAHSWNKIPFNFKELNLEVTLTCAQSFRWQKKDTQGCFRSVLADHVISLKQDKDTGDLLYQVHLPKAAKKSKRSTPYEKPLKNSNFENILKNYFIYDVSLEKCYQEWGKEDPQIGKLSSQFYGIRILRQDPIENLFSFICSSNNNIPRITSLVEKLCSNFGEELMEFEGQTYHKFPSLKDLAAPEVESKLRELGFGYRAKFIQQSAKVILEERPSDWLHSLRFKPYGEVHAALTQLPGIGAKVADCISLMSLDKWEAVPIDTHVWKLTCRDYLPHLKANKSLTDKSYKEIGNFFRNKYGCYAGWAHSLLFCAELKQFQHLKK